jgi:hypothetical protein
MFYDYLFIRTPGRNLTNKVLRKESSSQIETPYEHSLDSSTLDYDKIFSVVKKTVKNVVGKERSGLGLALSNLPSNLGAFWQIGGNYIVMNEIIIGHMKKVTKSPQEFNAFIYSILTHEYLHSVGYIDELQARQMTAYVSTKSFGSNHPASIISSGDLWVQFPSILSVTGGDGSRLKIISKFDSETTSYIT